MTAGFRVARCDQVLRKRCYKTGGHRPPLQYRLPTQRSRAGLHFRFVVGGILFIPMPFEFDPQKSAANKAKHGIDFVEAQWLWQDSDRLEVAARSDDEQRSIVVGRIQETTRAACVTYRNEETIRIISVRRARARERQEYERSSASKERDSG